MSYFLNAYAGMRILDRPDSWFEPDDTSVEERAAEFIAEWILDNTTIPHEMVNDALVDPLVDDFIRDPDVLCDSVAADLQESYDRYCEILEMR